MQRPIILTSIIVVDIRIGWMKITESMIQRIVHLLLETRKTTQDILLDLTSVLIVIITTPLPRHATSNIFLQSDGFAFGLGALRAQLENLCYCLDGGTEHGLEVAGVEGVEGLHDVLTKSGDFVFEREEVKIDAGGDQDLPLAGTEGGEGVGDAADVLDGVGVEPGDVRGKVLGLDVGESDEGDFFFCGVVGAVAGGGIDRLGFCVVAVPEFGDCEDGAGRVLVVVNVHEPVHEGGRVADQCGMNAEVGVCWADVEIAHLVAELAVGKYGLVAGVLCRSGKGKTYDA